jgi:hypothetical protein
MQSPRTADYVQALIREGDSFDYRKWLARVRAKESPSPPLGKLDGTSTDVGSGPSDIPAQARTVAGSNSVARPNRAAPAISSTAHCSPSNRRANGKIEKNLKQVRAAWDRYQSTRERDAIYGYLKAVYSVVAQAKARSRLGRLVKNAQLIAGLPIDRKADPFSTLIKCTSEGSVDLKAVSKWSRVLRYAMSAKADPKELREFIKRKGGLNACAAEYANRLRRRMKNTKNGLLTRSLCV